MRSFIFGCVGSRGDVQPFLHLGQSLQRDLSCRVVVASGATAHVRACAGLRLASRAPVPCAVRALCVFLCKPCPNHHCTHDNGKERPPCVNSNAYAELSDIVQGSRCPHACSRLQCTEWLMVAAHGLLMARTNPPMQRSSIMRKHVSSDVRSAGAGLSCMPRQVSYWPPQQGGRCSTFAREAQEVSTRTW